MAVKRFYQIVGYLKACPTCGKMGNERDMQVLYGNTRYCDECFASAQAEHACVCILCSGVYYARYPEINSPCNPCLWSIPETQEEKVKTHLRRALKAGKPATLTVDEWIATLTDFRFKCAYCLQAEYEVLEHFRPVESAGTTAENCIPACQSCNIRKRQDRANGIPAADLNRVRAYLVNRYRTTLTPAAMLATPEAARAEKTRA